MCGGRVGIDLEWDLVEKDDKSYGKIKFVYVKYEMFFEDECCFCFRKDICNDELKKDKGVIRLILVCFLDGLYGVNDEIFSSLWEGDLKYVKV